MTDSSPQQPFYKRRGLQITALVIAVPALLIAWYLFSPLFLNSTVIEDFPRAAAAQIPDDMTASEVEDAMITAEADSSSVADDMPTAGAMALVTGEIVGADSFHQGSGTATIYVLDDGSRVLRLVDLEVTNVPDLHVLISPAPNPEGRDDVTAAGYIDLGSLKGNRGSQNYDVPADYELPDTPFSVVIYFQPFHVLFASASLSA